MEWKQSEAAPPPLKLPDKEVKFKTERNICSPFEEERLPQFVMMIINGRRPLLLSWPDAMLSDVIK